MPHIQFINSDSLLKWLKDLEVDHYLCGQCQGVHIADLQSQEGVLESRVFLEQECLIFTTEVELRASALLNLVAELPRLNGAYANIKTFADLADDGAPRVIMCDTLWVSAGVTKEQLGVFLRNALEAKQDILREILDCGFVATADAGAPPAPMERALH
ncbi:MULTISPECIES: YbjN domain-containing protein [unclassified Hahella]|uniref:YbjN domain-containing protein n=1 Tax=unclassified Hahella TaxID=2624107 RepID=UPI001C1EC294|nr:MULTISPECIES: YbjN domain-containing protein [unclassified Hahella]MBU6950501.1 YbjN domain-containing protein [Hahella sp. HN01]MDG9667958.1 YbjN domain-containing protein [Hahella sp. CR1]